MRFLVFMLILFPLQASFAQMAVKGKVIERTTGEAVAFAIIKTSEENVAFSNISGEFEINITDAAEYLLITRRGYVDVKKNIEITQSERFVIELSPNNPGPGSALNEQDDLAVNEIIKTALKNKSLNDPQQVLNSYTFKSYNRLVIDAIKKEDSPVNSKIENKGRSFLSEKVSEVFFKKYVPEVEFITGLKTYGFSEPVYEVLILKTEPTSIYEDDYPLYGTNFAGPLGQSAFENYTYTLLDTINTAGKPGFMIYFKPKRPGIVAGWEGVLFLDTQSFGVQRVISQLDEEIKIEIDQNYTYLGLEKLYFPSHHTVILKPGSGGKNITVFGGSISLGTVQRKSSILNWVISTGKIEEDLGLISTTTNYDIFPNETVEISRGTAAITVIDEAHTRSAEFWDTNRQIPINATDELTTTRVAGIIEQRNILRKIEVLHTLLTGFYPVKFWDFDLSSFIAYNNYEGLRLGAGGRTNQNFSNRIRVQGYLAYGLKDEAFKYDIGGGVLLDDRSGTWWNINYNKDLLEIAVNDYIRGVNEFSILEPRTANISSYYSYKTLATSLEHRFTSRLETELLVSRSEISQTGDYAFINNGERFTDYTISEVKFGLLWRPFSHFLSTPQFHRIIEKGYPIITAQVTRGISGLFDGDFGFTKLGVKAEYQLNRQDRSLTQFTLEGNYGFGELPLTHAFHAFPNNANKEEVLQRFAVAGKIAFETMYFDEFFSDKQASLHIRHQLRPFNIMPSVQPELSFISRHVIGDFNKVDAHQNINFNTLEHVYSEAGVELNNIFFGLGLSAAYRYGAYHLPIESDNISFKFTFELKI